MFSALTECNVSNLLGTSTMFTRFTMFLMVETYRQYGPNLELKLGAPSSLFHDT